MAHLYFKGITSWQAFDKSPGKANIVITPGCGFGSQSEGFFHLNEFNRRANAEALTTRRRL